MYIIILIIIVLNKENWAYQRNLEDWHLPGCPPWRVADDYKTNFRQITKYDIHIIYLKYYNDNIE